MNNELYNGNISASAPIKINGVEHELINGLYYPIVSAADEESNEYEYADPVYEPSESAKESKNNRRPSLNKPTKVFLGTLAVGMFVIPPAVHMGTEQVTNYFIDLASPTEDTPLTQDQLISDIGKSFEELGPKTIGKIIEGLR